MFRNSLAVLAMCVVVGVGCKKSEEPKPLETKKPAPSAEKAEVEFFGKWKSEVTTYAKALFVVQVEPCLPVPAKPTRFGETKLNEMGDLFAEYFIAQGSTGHACVYLFDEGGKVIGAAGTSQNPMTFEGQGEVIKGKLEFSVTTTSAN